MAENAFQKVKEAVPAQADAILAEHGIKNVKDGTRLKGLWTTGFLCPFCGDQSGSASFTPQLFLRCHQCGTKKDIFDWLSQHTSCKPWDACKKIAERLSVQLPKTKRPARTARGMPPRMTEDILQASLVDLWDHKDAAPAREILAERKLDDQQLCHELGVGWIRGWITFASRDEQGQLLERFRGWNPNSTKNKWMWFGQGTGGTGIWPTMHSKEGDKILLLEGEGDVMTAWMRLRLHEQGWHPCTWTAGATSCPKARDIPRNFHGKEVHVGYDNDVFQGPVYKDYYVETKPGKDPNHARMALEQRLRNLLQRVAPLFESLNSDVVIRQCPVDPKEKFGGDLRDWVDAGGRDLADWTAYPFPDLPDYGRVLLDLEFSEVFSNLHRQFRTTIQVEAIRRDDVTLSKLFEMRCEIGQHPSCATCPGARLFPDGMIDMIDYQRELAVGLEQQHVSDKIIRDVIQRPRGCPRVEVVPLDVQTGSEWRGCQPGKVNDATQRILHVFSEEPPSLSGEMEIEGICFPNARGNGVVMLANSVKQLDKAEVDLGPVEVDLRGECPSFTNKVEDIDAYLDRRARDLAYNVTRIYGRRDICVAHDLLAHSARRATMWGAKQRSWLDICVFGTTRTGKSLTFRRLFEHHGLGIHHTAVSNISRAGLIMGADKDGMMKPGVMPRCNGKMLMLDELHFLVKNNRLEHPMSWMQSVRDDGVASGVKIYGNRDLPAQVRLACLSNWMRDRRAFEFPCEHLKALYGSPEMLARLDFAICVDGRPEQTQLDRVEQFWTKDRTRSLILRAWAMEPEQILIDDEAFSFAMQQCLEWEGNYEEEQLPLFTPEEKSASVMRIAIAIANVCFSHPKDDPYSCHVRLVHAKWAAQWLEHTWALSQYDVYSRKHFDSQRIHRPFEVERRLTVSLGLDDPMIAEAKLSMLLTPFTANEVGPITGLDNFAAGRWLSSLTAMHLFERVRENNAYHVRYQLTRGGSAFIQNMIRLASEDEQKWNARATVLKGYQSGMPEPDLTPLTAAKWELLDDGDDREDLEKIPF